MRRDIGIRKSAFTLIELLVVVAIIALLISILMPSLEDARRQGKKAKCLSNFRTLSNASVCYASEDKKENAVGIHQNDISARAWSDDGGIGDDSPYFPWLRLGISYTFGGRTATIPVHDGGGWKQAFMKTDGRWAMRTRPLNIYVIGRNGIGAGDDKKVEWYHCPSDVGYPNDHVAEIQECSAKNRLRPLYSMLGSSYRINFAGFFDSGGKTGMYTTSGWGHRLTTLNSTGRLALYCEPLFYAMAFPLNRITLLRGWHGKFDWDNVAYADGSARYTKCEGLQDFDDKTLKGMNMDTGSGTGDYHWALRRGPTWQTDNYPTPLAVIPWKDTSGKDHASRPGDSGWSWGNPKMWPMYNFQDNMRNE